MQNLPDTGSAEVWSAAQHRRSEDLAKWFSAAFKKSTSAWFGLPRVTARGQEFATYAFLAVAFAGVGLLCSGLLAFAFI
jgi:hypothetical protein